MNNRPPNAFAQAPHNRSKVHIVCCSCATELYKTSSERPHEIVTESSAEASLFRMAHGGHSIRELVVV